MTKIVLVHLKIYNLLFCIDSTKDLHSTLLSYGNNVLKLVEIHFFYSKPMQTHRG